MSLSNARWFKSSYSGSEHACVETAFLDDGRVAVRDTKNRDGGTLIFTPAEWDAFTADIADHKFVG
ncbi:DUF397 domain-containing protein [Nocardia sp. KC 131]|uniref:DUF397 domain-containing protein n=1 Tax=Nocardia arseniciresistens TaxID=3392119 RepID=UPI00398E9F81